jgi:hypothetical protein
MRRLSNREIEKIVGFPWDNHVIPEKQKPKTKRRLDALRKDGERTERLDMRLTKAEKRKLEHAAKVSQRTITSIIAQLIAEMK